MVTPSPSPLPHPYDQLPKTTANFVPLSPLSFLKRTQAVYPDRIGVSYGSRSYTWRETYQRSVKLASALNHHGIGINDTVSIIAMNTPEMIEAHFGVPMAGAVLNTINVRLDPDTIAYILEHGDAKVLITDTAFSTSVKAALKQLGRELLVIDIVDEQFDPPAGAGERLGGLDYETFIESGSADFAWQLPEDEWQALALNYTSGTTGRPKGVVYHHRGAYLMSMGIVPAWNLTHHPRYLYIVPLFHCNGWCHVWTMTILAGTLVCCRTISAANIFKLIGEHHITHFGGAPIVLNMLASASDEEKGLINHLEHQVQVFTAGAPPPSSVLANVEALGFHVDHVYGLTETYGHVTQCARQETWNTLSLEERADIKSRQGVGFPMHEEVQVLDPATGEPITADGHNMGEIMLRGNTVMKGYYKNSEATEKAFAGGYFHSGDLAVMHPDGYVQIKDRSKDIIISGAENISSVEVENVLYKHPAVVAAAVVARPDDTWGEIPCAFLELHDTADPPSAEDIIAFCRERLSGFKTPKTIIFGPLPKTATGKIQKFELRERARNL